MKKVSLSEEQLDIVKRAFTRGWKSAVYGGMECAPSFELFIEDYVSLGFIELERN